MEISFVEAQRDVQFLLHYAASQGITVRNAVISRLLKVIRGSGEITTKDEIAFWEAYIELSQQLAPVSVDSILASHETPHPSSSLFRKIRAIFCGRSIANRTVRRYQYMAIATLFALIFVQIIWVTGATITQDVVQLEDRLTELVRQRNDVRRENARRQVPTRRPEDSTVVESSPLSLLSFFLAGATSPKESEISYNITKTEKMIQAGHENLSNWNHRWGATILFQQTEKRGASPKSENEDAKMDQQEDDGEVVDPGSKVDEHGSVDERNGDRRLKLSFYSGDVDNEVERRIEISSAVVFLGALSSYVLPFLYGLLGACAFVLRRMDNELRSRTFTTQSSTGYSLRLALGPLAGVATAFLVVPSAESTTSVAPEVLDLSVLSPLALAFVAGYGVELLFSFMDRIVGTFTRQ